VSIPFVLTSVESVKARSVRNGPYRLYLCLLTYKNRTTGQCNPRRKRLAKDLGVSEPTISRWLRALRSVGWVNCRHTLHGQKYTLLDPVAPKFGERKNDPSAGIKNDPSGRIKNDPDEAQPSLYEPEVLVNQINTTAAADETRSCMAAAKASAAAAAAAGDAFASTNANTSPPKPMRDVGEPCGRSMRDVGENPDKADMSACRPLPEIARAADRLVEELIPEHPEPGNPTRAIAEARTVLAASADLQATIETIRSNHASWREHWATLPGDRFIPQLWRWFLSGEWKYPPAGRKCVQREQRETYVERQDRERRALDERHWLILAQMEEWDELRAEGQDPEVWRERLKVSA